MNKETTSKFLGGTRKHTTPSPGRPSLMKLDLVGIKVNRQTTHMAVETRFTDTSLRIEIFLCPWEKLLHFFINSTAKVGRGIFFLERSTDSSRYSNLANRPRLLSSIFCNKPLHLF